MKRIITFVALCAALISCRPTTDSPSADAFVRIDGTDLVRPDGQKLFIRGTNLGNWLNPEGYMFGFSRTNSPHMIDLMLRQAVGPDDADDFWQRFKESYITREDIRFIASTGANTIRLPFNYRIFTDEDYMGLKASQDGFARVDELVEWCREEGLYLILDMHDAPGGQTGDNIDDSYGYPWLFESEASQRLFCDIWRSIAERYRDETTILGYELLNEPIAPYFDNVDQLNARLKEVYRMGVEAIREVDDNHIILLGGAQWNGNFTPLDGCNFDDKIMYTCHRYGGGTSADAIRSFIDFRDRTGRPMYMGEIGHNTYEWMSEFCRTMQQNDIGYTFWPYKKIGSSSWVGFEAPEGWQQIVEFSQAQRGSYGEIREARGDMQAMRRSLDDLIEAVRFENCRIDTLYIRAIGLDLR